MRPTGSAFYNFCNGAINKYFYKKWICKYCYWEPCLLKKEKGLLVYAYYKKSKDLQLIISTVNNNLCDTIGILKNLPQQKLYKQ